MRPHFIHIIVLYIDALALMPHIKKYPNFASADQFFFTRKIWDYFRSELLGSCINLDQEIL